MNTPAELARDSRPYRSHRIPACTFCYERKTRCHRDRLAEPCALCRDHGKQCIPRMTSHGKRRRRAGDASEHAPPVQQTGRQSSQAASSPTGREASRAATNDHATQNAAESPLETRDHGLSSHIVGPTVAPDVWMLEQYMSPTNTGAVSHVHPNPYSVYSADPRNPVVYLKVPKQRTLASMGNGSSGLEQFEIIENIVSPLGPHLLDL